MNLKDNIIYHINIYNEAHFCVFKNDYNHGFNYGDFIGCATHKNTNKAHRDLARLLISDYSGDSFSVSVKALNKLSTELKYKTIDEKRFRICGLFVRECLEY